MYDNSTRQPIEDRLTKIKFGSSIRDVEVQWQHRDDSGDVTLYGVRSAKGASTEFYEACRAVVPVALIAADLPYNNFAVKSITVKYDTHDPISNYEEMEIHLLIGFTLERETRGFDKPVRYAIPHRRYVGEDMEVIDRLLVQAMRYCLDGERAEGAQQEIAFTTQLTEAV